MKLQIITDQGKEALITIEQNIVQTVAYLETEGNKTSDFAFIAPNAAELVEHFLLADDVDFAVGVTGANSITKAPKSESNNHGHSLMSVLFKKSGNVMPLGELSPNFVPEITSTLMASFQKDEDKIVRGIVTNITGFELLGKVVEIKYIGE